MVTGKKCPHLTELDFMVSHKLVAVDRVLAIVSADSADLTRWRLEDGVPFENLFLTSENKSRFVIERGGGLPQEKLFTFISCLQSGTAFPFRTDPLPVISDFAYYVGRLDVAFTTDTDFLNVPATSDVKARPTSSVADVFDGDSYTIGGVDSSIVEAVASPTPSKKSRKESPVSSGVMFKLPPLPNAAEFYVSSDVWTQLCYGLAKSKNVLITGPSGSGKSEVVYKVSEACGVPLEMFNMGAMSEPRTSLIGNTHFSKEAGTWFEPSRFVGAIQKDSCCILLDELTRAERGAFNILLPLLDRQGYLALDESEHAAIIKKSPGVCFIATANVGMEYTGTDAMDKALRDRFDCIIDMEFPPEDAEARILLSRCSGLSKADASKLVTAAKTQRHLARVESEFLEVISTRSLIAAGSQIALGVPFKVAVQFCIYNQFSADGGETSDRTKISQIFQKGGL
jgi:nitric oxide reductase NorQ protein